jgi:hypothetical protein
MFKLASGDIFNPAKVRQGLDQMLSAYAERGYRNFTIVPEASIDDSRYVISLSLTVMKASRSASPSCLLRCRREEFDGAVSTECKQSGTPRPPSCEEGHRRLHTHPCDCDGLHPANSSEGVGTTDLQHRDHLGEYDPTATVHRWITSCPQEEASSSSRLRVQSCRDRPYP